MVLTARAALQTSVLAGCALAFGSRAEAQSLSEIAPAVGEEEPEYRNAGIDVGGVRVVPAVRASATYNDNVYAEPTSTEGDVLFTLRPEVSATYNRQNLRLEVLADASVHRHAELTSEDSEAGNVEARFSVAPGAANRLTLSTGYSRLIEDRGDPEALNATLRGPRKIDSIFGRAQFRREAGRLLFDLDGEVRKFDAVSALDAERDFTSLAGRARLGTRVGGVFYVTGTGFVSNRNFRLGGTALLPDRDATTYGGRLGIEILSGGLLQGHLGAGVFRFEPRDARIAARTGISAEGSLTYRPSRRTAVVFDAFRGDVATFRLGAQARTDARLSLSLQQEARHNLFFAYGLGWRKSRFVGTPIAERAIFAEASAEWVVSRHLAILGGLQFTNRASDDPLEEFERFRGTVSVRYRL